MTDDLTTQNAPPSLLHRIFIGNLGIRAGWSIGIFLIIMAILTALFIIPTQYVLEKNNLPIGGMHPIPVGAGELAGFLGLLAASMVMTRIEHKPLISYGIDGTKRLIKFLYGMLSGFMALSILAGILMICGLLHFDNQNIFGWVAVQYAIAWGIVFFLVSLYEEYFLRGYLQSTLTRGIGFWWSALILSGAFGCMHLFNKGESPVGICSAVLIGLVFCVSLWYLKNLWWAIGFHTSWNWSESYLWGTANSGTTAQGHLLTTHPDGNILLSGGPTGPEGSLLVIPLILIIGLIMWIVWRKTTGLQANNNKSIID